MRWTTKQGVVGRWINAAYLADPFRPVYATVHPNCYDRLCSLDWDVLNLNSVDDFFFIKLKDEGGSYESWQVWVKFENGKGRWQDWLLCKQHQRSVQRELSYLAQQEKDETAQTNRYLESIGR